MITQERKLTIREIRVYLWLRHRARERSIRRFIHRFIFLILPILLIKGRTIRLPCRLHALTCNADFPPKKDRLAW